MTINVDFTKGAVNSLPAAGGPTTYGPDGVEFTVASSGQAPQVASLFYIMFGRVEITMKAAPGAGIVSSVVLESDDLDEIDMEWVGGDSAQVQTNYFGKGFTGDYDRGEFNPAADNQNQFLTYIIDWTSERVVWSVGGTVVRTLKIDDAKGQYPQSPMQVKFGAWSGGDAANDPGTIEWAGGPTDYSKGPFTMTVKSVSITDYSTGDSYSYGDQSGSWQSIVSHGGEINGNLGDAGDLSVTASAAAATGVSPSVPAGGIGTGGTATAAPADAIPSGWRMTPEGKIVPNVSSAVRIPNLLLVSAPLLVGTLTAASWLL